MSLRSSWLVVVLGCADEPNNPRTNPDNGPPAGNPDGTCASPDEAKPASIANPRTVVGTGTAASCTGDAFVDAVAKGVIRDSKLSNNPSGGFETQGFPGIFVLANGPPMVTSSTIN